MTVGRLTGRGRAKIFPICLNSFKVVLPINHKRETAARKKPDSKRKNGLPIQYNTTAKYWIIFVFEYCGGPTLRSMLGKLYYACFTLERGKMFGDWRIRD